MKNSPGSDRFSLMAAALLRFDWLTAHQPAKPVEDLIARDRLMMVCELSWLALFAGGL